MNDCRLCAFLKFRQATRISLIEKESHQQTPEKTKNSDEHEKRDNINLLVS